MPVKLLQITDCHLGEDEGDKLLGLDTDESLQFVVSHMMGEHDSADLLVCSGDLSNEAGVKAYQRLIAKLPGHIPQAWLPGNHDDNDLMVTVMSDNRQFLPSISFDHWQVTLLDSSIPGEVPGLIAADELARAVSQLEAHPEKHHLIFMHHHLHPVGCKWLDTQVINNATEVLATFSRYPQLKLVICGHIHQDSYHKHAHFELYSTPSTCIQFMPKSDRFAVGFEMPGYRWIELEDDGSFKTAVSRIPERDLNIDRGSSGY